MVRRDEIDLGVWTRLSPARLIVPLDTHVIRLGRCLRLTRYTSPGWKMAAEITASLRDVDALDPVRYDFALCHVGMMNACGFERPQRDAQCPLRGLCSPKPRRKKVQGRSAMSNSGFPERLSRVRAVVHPTRPPSTASAGRAFRRKP
jgi:hypothetical protein